MKSDEAQFKQLVAWLQTYSPQTLTNEADVESKFIVPLFQHLGYSDDCRRPQYPVSTYTPSRRGQRPAIDQIYFSETERDKQTADTSLVIVEAKSPTKSRLDSVLQQARFYGYHLTPLFLVVSNGKRLLVAKRRGFRSEEFVLDVDVGDLQDELAARNLYRLLHFNVVKRAKEQLADDPTYSLHVDLMHALENHPDLQAQLARGDFVPSRTREGRRLSISKPKVAVVCDLPLVYGDGECHISFSNLLLRDLTCNLTHRQILEDLMTGLHTLPHWGTRRFLKQVENGAFEASLGNTTVLLGAEEAQELCDCVDDVCEIYKGILINAEDTLETWTYLPKLLPGYDLHGFEILSVDPWMWELMLQFAEEFDFLEGSTPWHIFDKGNNRLRMVRDREIEDAVIYPHYGLWDFPTREIDLIYCISKDDMLAFQEEWSGQSWNQAIGPKGRWTARYTERWLREVFIPKLLRHYAKQVPRQYRRGKERILGPKLESPSLAETQDPKPLAYFLHEVQGWCHIYSMPGECQVASALLRSYYATMTELVSSIVPSSLAKRYVSYILGNVSRAEELATPESNDLPNDEHEDVELGVPEVDFPLEDLDDDTPDELGVAEVISCLHRHVTRIYEVEHEYSMVADYVSSGLIGLLEHGEFHYSQELLNAAKRALQPLLDLTRFEERYILQPPVQW